MPIRDVKVVGPLATQYPAAHFPSKVVLSPATKQPSLRDPPNVVLPTTKRPYPPKFLLRERISEDLLSSFTLFLSNSSYSEISVSSKGTPPRIAFTRWCLSTTILKSFIYRSRLGASIDLLKTTASSSSVFFLILKSLFF